MLNLYKKLILFRQQSKALQLGAFVPLGLHNKLVVFKRKREEEEVLVAVNFGSESATYEPDFEFRGQLIVSTSGAGEGKPVQGKLEVKAEEALVVQLS